MSGITAQTSGGILGCEAGKGWMHSEVRRGRPAHRDLIRGKLILYPALIALLLTLTVPFPVFSQGAAGPLSGSVTSVAGSRIPNAHLSIRNAGSGETVSATGKEDGSYTVPNLVPGNYEVTATAPGFATARVAVTIRADADEVADVVLHPGNEQAGSSTVSGVVNSQNVGEVPFDRRSAPDFAALEPGVAAARTPSSGQGKDGFGTATTMSGGRPRQNDARLDGISVNDYANGSPGSALGAQLGVDA